VSNEASLLIFRGTRAASGTAARLRRHLFVAKGAHEILARRIRQILLNARKKHRVDAVKNGVDL